MPNAPKPRLMLAGAAAALVVALASAGPAAAQGAPKGVWGSNGVTIGPEPFKRPVDQQDRLTNTVSTKKSVVAGDPWPRLDAGAVVCETEDDLQRRLMIETATAQGETVPEGATPRCRRLASMVPVSVVRRDGPARTQVKLDDGSAQGGWTSVYLPDHKPSTSASAAR